MVEGSQYDWLDANGLPVWVAVARHGAGGYNNKQLQTVPPGFSLSEVQNQIYSLRRSGLVVTRQSGGKSEIYVTLPEPNKLEEALAAHPAYRLAYWATVAGEHYRLPPLLGLVTLWGPRVSIVEHSVARQNDFTWLSDRSVGPVATVLAADRELTAKEVAALCRESRAHSFLASATRSKMLKRFYTYGSGYHYFGQWRPEYAKTDPVLHWALLVLMARQSEDLPPSAPSWARDSLPGFASYMTERFLNR